LRDILGDKSMPTLCALVASESGDRADRSRGFVSFALRAGKAAGISVKGMTWRRNPDALGFAIVSGQR
jgi:hypothetical protein